MPLPSTEREVLLFSIGWATQRWLTGKPDDEDTIEVDGIQVTPDACWDGNPWELKATYTSSDRSILENDSWVKQIMAQCYVTKTLTARLSRLELMGNWRSIFGSKDEKKLAINQKPALSAWKFEFAQDELSINWTYLLSRKTLFEELIKNPQQLLQKNLALPVGHEFECEQCAEPYRNLCEGKTKW